METDANADVSKSFDLHAYVRVVLRRRWVILGTLVATVGLAALYGIRQPKVYSANASLIIDVTAPRFLDKDVQEVMDNGTGNYWWNREYYETQHRVITSRAVASRVVDKLGLQNDAAFLGVEKVKDPEKRNAAMAAIDAPARVQNKIKVQPVKESRLVKIVVEDTDPNRAALLANEVAEAYMAENLALRLKVTETASKWLEDRLVSLEDKSKKSDMAVFDFKKQADMLTTSLEDRASMISQRLTSLNATLTDVRMKIASLKARVDAIRELKRASGSSETWPEALAGVSENTLYIGVKSRYLEARAECAELRERYLSGHPKLAACEEKLATIKADFVGQLNTFVLAAETELKEAQLGERNLSGLFETAKAEAFEIEKRKIEFERLKHDADNDQRLYDTVLKRLKDIELSGLLRTSNVRVLDAARPAFAPVKPRLRTIMLVALLLGLLAGLGLAFVLEFIDNTISSQADIENVLRLPFLGLVPNIPEDKAPSLEDRDLHIHRQPKSSVAECCRAIRTNLLFMSPDKQFKSLVVTSGSPQEGKSTAVINLGIAMAQSGNRVVLLDTDMRRPRLHKAFGVPNDIGVSSLVVGEGTLEDAVKTTEVPNLFVLPCGPIPPNPAEMLHTQAFRDLLDRLAKKYDRIILDSPPIGPVADAAVLSTQVDGVVMVLKSGRTSRDVARRAVRALRDVKARVFGAILNDINLADPKYGYYYDSYSRYGHYYAEKKDELAS